MLLSVHVTRINTCRFEAWCKVMALCFSLYSKPLDLLPITWVVSFHHTVRCYCLDCVHYLSHILSLLLVEDSLLGHLLVAALQTLQLLVQLLGVAQDLVLQGGRGQWWVVTGSEVSRACHCTSWGNWDMQWTHPAAAADLPSPCAVSPPLHPGCSQVEPRRRWRRRRRLGDCSASPPAPQSDIQATRSPPRNNEPAGQRETEQMYKYILDSLPQLPRTERGRRWNKVLTCPPPPRSSSPARSGRPGGRSGQRWRSGPGRTGSDPPCSETWRPQSPAGHSHTCPQPDAWEENKEHR